jgi:sarcosine oxidase
VANYDVIVVGLGAMGSSATYQLSQRGLRVLGLEAFEPGHRLGSSHGESRVIRMAYFEHPNFVPLLRRAYELWRDLESRSGEKLLHITGGLMIGDPSSDLVSGARASADLHSLEHEVLSSDELRNRYPAFRPQDHEVALWEPEAGFLRPEACIEAFVRLSGAEAHYSEPVRAWRATGSTGVEVATSAATYQAQSLVFACGARHSKLPGVSTPPVTPERVPLFWLQPSEPDLFAESRFPIYLWQTESADVFYGFPHVEWPGVKVARHHSREVCDPDAMDRTATPHDEALLRNLIASRIPALNGPVASSLVCVYENSPDEIFLIDRLREQTNVVYAAGFSGHGFKFSSVVGEILADLVTRGSATPDADFLRADRFAVRS